MQIAILGRDGSGKSTLADYLSTFFARSATAVLIDTDLTQPTIPNRLPKNPADKENSLGRALTGAGSVEIRPFLFSHPRQSGLFLAGLVKGDEFLDYELGLETAQQATHFAKSCLDMADHVILDCSGQRTDPFIPAALTASDQILVLLNLSLESINWWHASKKLLSEMADPSKVILIVNRMQHFMQQKWLSEALGRTPDFILPLAAELAQLRSTGRTTKPPVSKAGLAWYRQVKQIYKQMTQQRGEGHG